MAKQGDNREAGARPGRRWLLGLGKLGLTIGALALVLRQLDLPTLSALARGVDPLLFAFAVSYTTILVGLKPLRWLWLLRGVLPGTPYRVALRSWLCGASGRLVLPGKVGEFTRVLMVDGLKPLPGAGLTALDLLLEATAAFALALPGALILGGPVAATTVLFLTAACTLVLLQPQRVLGPVARLPGLGSLGHRLAGVEQVMETLGRRTVIRGLGLSVAIHLVKLAQLTVIFVALGVTPNAAAVIFFPLIGLADGFPLTVGGLGAREWLSVLILPLGGIPPEAAVAAVLLQFVISSGLPGLAGAWLWLRGRPA